ncbi:helix-turn-helix domain-containing protein [Proteocatella sphenisci]|uniref:helix-turn-helix domain-containing protein n=1 Tax=Proteocatella sphenisci TaxID=181070 RepID=UPI00048C51F8|nr:helix-turn-helix transcriptional regulator [Proteocatella sphenisci]
MNPDKFGDFVTEKRKDKDLSLRKMAEMLELSPAYWSDIEKGRRNPPGLSKLMEIATLLGLSQEETDYMIDIASQDRDEIPMDLPEYIKESNLARIALRKARKKNEEEGKSDVTEKAWRDFIKTLDGDK